MIDTDKLKKYLENNKNVLLSGSHGIGKTEIIKKVFEEAGMKWRYFSAATMDPYVDFIGIPKSAKDEHGEENLVFVRNKDLNHVEALFFDEFNRAPKKILNAVMELIQFKSINGVKFPNLKVVWAAINPHDEEETYAVEKLDPAIMDRFHIHIPMAIEVDENYFYTKYGDISVPFVRWWRDLPVAQKKQISPRRLDYAVDIHNMGGDLEDVFPQDFNFEKLTYFLQKNNGPSSSVFAILNDMNDLSFDERCNILTIEASMNLLPTILESTQYHHLLLNLSTEVIEKEVKDGHRKFIRLIKKHFKGDYEFQEKVWPFLSKTTREALE